MFYFQYCRWLTWPTQPIYMYITNVLFLQTRAGPIISQWHSGQWCQCFHCIIAKVVNWLYCQRIMLILENSVTVFYDVHVLLQSRFRSNINCSTEASCTFLSPAWMLDRDLSTIPSSTRYHRSVWSSYTTDERLANVAGKTQQIWLADCCDSSCLIKQLQAWTFFFFFSSGVITPRFCRSETSKHWQVFLI